MLRYLAIMFATLCSGCFLTLERQQSTEYVFNCAKQSAVEVGKVNDAAATLVSILSKPEATETDTIDLNTALAKISTSLSSIAEYMNEIGKTANVMQEDFGTPEPAEKVTTKDEADGMRARYRAKAKVFNAIKGFIASKTGFPLPKSAPSQPWNISEILLAVAGVGGTSKVGKMLIDQFLKYKRAAHEGHRALGELKKDVQPERFASVMEKNQGMVIIHQEQKSAAVMKKG